MGFFARSCSSIPSLMRRSLEEIYEELRRATQSKECEFFHYDLYKTANQDGIMAALLCVDTALKASKQAISPALNNCPRAMYPAHRSFVCEFANMLLFFFYRMETLEVLKRANLGFSIPFVL